MVVDLGKVTYIDSSTIGVLLSEQKRLDVQKGGLKLLNVKGAPRNVIEMARLQGVFSIFDDERKAIESFGETA
ncbi:MAG: STAS domain-containing protein [bacterium]